MSDEALVIRPVAIGPAQLVSSSVAEDVTTPEYNAGTTYAKDAVVQISSTHKLWKSRVAGNVNNPPATSPDQWALAGATTRWGMFDLEVASATSQAVGPLVVTIRPGLVGGLALFSVVGGLCKVEARDYTTGLVLYSSELPVVDAMVLDWYEYFFSPRPSRADLLYLDLPPNPNIELTVTVSGDGEVSIGKLAVGTLYSLGSSQYGIAARLISNSRIKTDADTNVTSVKRGATVRSTTVQLAVPAARLNRTLALFNDLQDVICVWVPVPQFGYEALALLGWHRDMTMSLPHLAVHTCTLKLEGVLNLVYAAE